LISNIFLKYPGTILGAFVEAEKISRNKPLMSENELRRNTTGYQQFQFLVDKNLVPE